MLTTRSDLDGSPASLAGQRIGIVEESLGKATLAALRPQAKQVPLTSAEEGVIAFEAGRLDGLVGRYPTAAMLWRAWVRKTVPRSAIWRAWPSGRWFRAMSMTHHATWGW